MILRRALFFRKTTLNSPVNIVFGGSKHRFYSNANSTKTNIRFLGPVSLLIGGAVVFQTYQTLNGDEDFSFSSAKLVISLTYSSQLVVQRKGAQALSFLCERDDYCSSLLREGALESLAHLGQSKDPLIQTFVFKSICSLSSKELAKSEIVKRGWLSYFSWFTHNSASEHVLSKRECEILYLIAKSLSHLTDSSDAKLIHAIDEAGVLPILHHITSIMFPPDSQDPKELVTQVYYNMAKYDNMRIKLCEGREGLDLLCKSTKESILIGVAKFFTELSKNDDARLMLVENSFLHYLVRWSSSLNNELRFQTALALAHLVENDEVAVYLLREYGSNLFLSLADINDIDVQHMVEAALNKMNKRAIDRDSPSKRVFVILDNLEIKSQ